MGKKNGKAKKKAEETPKFHADILPVKHRKLTPERAIEWMEQSFPTFQIYAEMGLAYAGTYEDRMAFMELNYDVRTMVEACMAAIRSQAPVRIESAFNGEYNHPKDFATISRLVHILSLPAIMQDEGEEFLDGRVFDAFSAFAGIARAYTGDRAESERRIQHVMGKFSAATEAVCEQVAAEGGA